MLEHSPENFPTLAHSLVAAHADRVREFARQYGRLAIAKSSPALSGPLETQVRTELVQSLLKWQQIDYQFQLNDMTELVGDERDAALYALRCGVEHVHELSEEDGRSEVEPILRQALETLGPMPRSAVRSVNFRARQIRRLQELDPPGIVIAGEARGIARALENWKSPPQAWPDTLDWQGFGYMGLFAAGLQICRVIDGTGNCGRDLGLGVSHAVTSILPLHDSDYGTLLELVYEDSDSSLELAYSEMATFPLVPTKRFHDLGPTFTLVRDYAVGTGPIGWVCDDAVEQLAEAVEGLRYPAYGDELRGVGARLRDAHRDGYAVLGCLELVTYEGDGLRRWLVNRDDDRDRSWASR